MKKFGFAIVALLVLSLALVSCKPADDMEVLTADDITADWLCDGTWAGTQEAGYKYSDEIMTVLKLIGISEDDLIEKNSEDAKKFDSYDLAYYKLLASYDFCTIKANKERTKFTVEGSKTISANDEDNDLGYECTSYLSESWTKN